MEILFENYYVRDISLLKEIYTYSYFKNPLLLIMNFFIILFTLINLYFCILKSTFSFSLFIAPIYFLFVFFRYKSYVKNTIKRDNEVNGGKNIEVNTIATDEYIQNTASTGSVYKVPYDNIKNCKQTKNLILLYSKANLIYIFRKDTFSKGSANEFIEFLKNKGINVL